MLVIGRSYELSIQVEEKEDAGTTKLTEEATKLAEETTEYSVEGEGIKGV